MKLRMAMSFLTLLALAGCGPSIGGTPVQCAAIDAHQYEAAKESGAALAEAHIAADGTSDVQTSGVQHCTRFKSTMKVCRRPKDFVIRYRLADDSLYYVIVRKGERYRFNTHARPTTCEIMR